MGNEVTVRLNCAPDPQTLAVRETRSGETIASPNRSVLARNVGCPNAASETLSIPFR